jgi:hypothetical protein
MKHKNVTIVIKINGLLMVKIILVCVRMVLNLMIIKMNVYVGKIKVIILLMEYVKKKVIGG